MSTSKQPKRRQRVALGDVFEIPLPDGRFAYGRVLEEPVVAIYQQLSTTPNNPPIGSRDYRFVVGIYTKVLKTGEWKIVGRDPVGAEEDPTPPPRYIKDPVDGSFHIYSNGKISPATHEECIGLEPAAVWDSNHIVDRILKGDASKYLRSVREL